MLGVNWCGLLWGLLTHTNAVVTIRRICECVLSTCKNVGKIWVSIRGEYYLSTDLGARRHTIPVTYPGGRRGGRGARPPAPEKKCGFYVF